MHRPAVVFLALLFTAPAWASVEAQLQPRDALVVGEPATLRVTRDGSGPPPELPRIEGAEVQAQGEMTRTTDVNGQTRTQTTYLFTLVPRREGPLRIPPIRVGNEVTRPLAASVVAPLSAPATSSGVRGSARTSGGARAFMTLDAPKGALYVGQSAPVSVHAFFQQGMSASLQGEPHLTSDGFTLEGLSPKPVQTEVLLHGVPYLEVTWTAMLTPAKASAGPVGVELPVELAYREAVRRRPRRSLRDLLDEDPFGDSFARQFFQQSDDAFADMEAMMDFGAVRRQNVTLQASADKLTVRELPSAGQPAGFGGAVGHFELSVEKPTGEPRVGEPLTLTAHVTGHGNFSRLAVQGLSTTADLKAYPGRMTLAAGPDRSGGGATFTQTVVPTRPGALVLPPLSASFFDPQRARYATARSQPLRLDVVPGEGESRPQATSAQTAPHDRAPEGVPTTTGSLEPRFRRRSFQVTFASLAFASLLCAALGLTWRSARLRRRLEQRALARDVEADLHKMNLAAEREDAAGFFASARRALQSLLGERWGVPAETITAADVRERMGERGLSLLQVLEQADRQTYASALGLREPLEPWAQKVRSEVAKLHSSKPTPGVHAP